MINISLVLCYRPSTEMVLDPEWGLNKYYWLKSNAWRWEMRFPLFLSLPTSLSSISVPNTVLRLQHQSNGGCENQERIYKCPFYLSLKHSGLGWDSSLLATCVEWVLTQEYYNIHLPTWNLTASSSQTGMKINIFQLTLFQIQWIPYITIFTVSQVSILFHILIYLKYECLLLSLVS